MSLNQRWIKAKETIAETLKGTHHEQLQDKRLPPGQHWTPGFPVLDLGIQPEMDMKTWKLKISGLAKEQELSLADLKKLGPQKVVQDFHCVTSWSKKDVQWTGIPLKKILQKVKPDPSWKFLIQYGADNYSTNVPREDVEHDDVFRLNPPEPPAETVQIKLSAEMLVDYRQDIEIEGRGDAGSVVICELEHPDVFYEIRAE